MGLDRFIGEADSSSTSGDSSDTSPSYDTSSRGYSWTTKLDFGADYIIVAKDAEGNIYKHEDTLAVMKDRLDWRRLDEHPSKELKVLYRCHSREDWLRFCNRAQEQLGIDPSELLEDAPERLQEIRSQVHYPKATGIDTSRDCRVCGTNSRDPTTCMVEINLETQTRVPVCASHTVEELADNDLLE